MTNTLQDRIRRKLTLPVNCSQCGKQSEKSIAWLVDHITLTCGCGYSVNLRTEEWQTLLNAMEHVIAQMRHMVTPLD